MEVLVRFLIAILSLIILLKLIELVKLVVQELQSIYILRLNYRRGLSNLLGIHNLVYFVCPRTSALRLIASCSASVPTHRGNPPLEIAFVCVLISILIMEVTHIVS